MRKIVSLVALSAFLGGCATISGFQTGKTIDKNTGQMGVSVGGGRTVFRTYLSGFDLDLPSVSMEIGGGYGITDQIDISLKYAVPITLGGTVRYGFLNEKRGAPVSVAVGVGVSYWSVSSSSGATKSIATSTDLSGILFVSRDLAEAVTLYITPRYVSRMAKNSREQTGFTTAEESLTTPMIGGGIGVMFNLGQARDKHLALEYNKVQWTEDSAYYSTQYGLALTFGI